MANLLLCLELHNKKAKQLHRNTYLNIKKAKSGQNNFLKKFRLYFVLNFLLLSLSLILMQKNEK